MDTITIYVTAFVRGVQVTILMTIFGFAAAIGAGLVLGLARLSKTRLLSRGSELIVEFFRGTSSLVQLFWVYYALPLLPFGWQPSPYAAALVVFGLNGGAYAAEIVRGSVQAIPRGQLDASAALSMNRFQELKIVVLPQAIQAMLPPFGNLAVEVLKGSAFVSIIGLQDFTFWINTARATTGESSILYGFALVVYFAIAIAIALIFRVLERITPLGRVARNFTNDLGITKRTRRKRNRLARPSDAVERIAGT